MAKTHYLREVVDDIDKSHPGLGKLVVVSMLSVKARKLLLVVSPRGCGKSRVSSFIGTETGDCLLEDRLSVAGLVGLKDVLTGFKGVIVVDDIAKTQTSYARITTITTMAELVYSHYCSSHLSKLHYEIDNFYGSAIINIQPVLLKSLVQSTEWEASIQDKSLRYYHLRRPLDPNPEPPGIKLAWGEDYDKVEKCTMKGVLAIELERLLEPQWGLSRLREHCLDLLRACAALDSRTSVTQRDYYLLLDVLKPLAIEKLIMDKADLESKRYLHSNKLAVLTEFITYGQFTLKQLARDYKVSETQAYRIMAEMDKEWRIVAKSPTTYAPTEDLTSELRRLKLI